MKPPLSAKVRVDLGERGYDVWVEPDCLRRSAAIILGAVQPSRALVVGGVGPVHRYAGMVERSLSEAGVVTAGLRLRSGERLKTLAAVARLYQGMLMHRMDRAGLVVAVGGGVIGDIAGFAAGTFMRGIAFVQAPTTLLAQADAGVGGKTGVNLPQGKNLIGVFHQPRAVLMDPTTLRSLQARDFRSGLAEIIKHGLIRDAGFLGSLAVDMGRLLDRDAGALTLAVTRSCEIKAEVVAEDETETGLRAILNFGHTVGHALEAETGYRRFRHGEAVAIGMVAACRIGEEMGVTEPKTTNRTVAALAQAGLPVGIPDDLDDRAVLAAMGSDKKTMHGVMKFVLLREVGDAVPGVVAEPGLVLRALGRSHRS